MSFAKTLSRDEMKKLMAGSGGCNPDNCNNCTAYSTGDPPCYKFECEHGGCVPKESTCCIAGNVN